MVIYTHLGQSGGFIRCLSCRWPAEHLRFRVWLAEARLSQSWYSLISASGSLSWLRLFSRRCERLGKAMFFGEQVGENRDRREGPGFRSCFRLPMLWVRTNFKSTEGTKGGCGGVIRRVRSNSSSLEFTSCLFIAFFKCGRLAKREPFFVA